MTVIANIIGGLGNQMFQYAASYALAKKNGLELKLDLDDYNTFRDRNFELPYAFDLKFSIASKKDVKNLIGVHSNIYLRRFLYRVGYRKNMLREKPYVLNKDFFDITNSIYLEGYWQNYNYFDSIKKDIRQQFKFKCLKNEEISFFFQKYKKKNVISMHVRKSDYINNKKNTHLFFNLTNNYYLQAVNFFKLKVSNPHFLIFSDDVNWVNNNINLQNTSYEILKPSLSPAKDMALMSLCNHNIIANSTFSWWAAWLNSSVNKIVITPQKWLKKDPQPIGLKIPEWISF